MESRPKRIVITGAEGVVGSVLRRGLSTPYDLVALTRTPQTYPSIVADIVNPSAMLECFTGANAVIHLAAAARLSAEWAEVLHNNIIGTRNVFEAAMLARVPTIVFASSGHVIGLKEELAGSALYELSDERVFDERTPLAPDSLYAVSKVFGESLGRVYSESFGMRVICVRLGIVLPDDDPCSDNPGRGRSGALPFKERFPRIRAKWLSHRDCCDLFSKCVENTSVRFAIVFGTSNNPRQIWSLDTARDLLKYEPKDAAPEHPP